MFQCFFIMVQLIVKNVFKENKTVIVMFIVMVMSQIVNIHEDYILKHIATIVDSSVGDPVEYSCPHVRDEYKNKVNQYTQFRWTQNQWIIIKDMRRYIGVFGFLFAGICSDKYGEHHIILLGLVMCGSVTSVLYLALINNVYIFLLMVSVRRIGDATITAAFVSLAGKLAKPDRRTIFISILFTGDCVGGILGNIVLKIVVNWKVLSYISGCVSFVAAAWWWMFSKQPHFPEIHTFHRNPWKLWRKLITSITFLKIGLLWLTVIFLFAISFWIGDYVMNVLFLKSDKAWLFTEFLYLARMSALLFCGASSDYLISRNLLHTYIVRRIFYSFSVIMFFCICIVIKVAGCNLTAVVACWITAHYFLGMAYSTSLAVLLDVAPTFSSLLLGSIFLPLYLVYFPLYNTLKKIFLSGGSQGNLDSWSGLFLTIMFLVVGLSLPYLLSELKGISWMNGDPIQNNRENFIMNSSTSRSAKTDQEHQLKNGSPEPLH